MIIVRWKGMTIKYPAAGYLTTEAHCHELWANSNKKQWIASVPFDAIIDGGGVQIDVQHGIFE